MGRKIANIELIENLMVELSDEETIMMKDSINAVIQQGITIDINNARQVLAHIMFENYKNISYAHTMVKDTFRQVTKKYMNGARPSVGEDKVCFDLIRMITEDE